jgi:hypothetical protein
VHVHSILRSCLSRRCAFVSVVRCRHREIQENVANNERNCKSLVSCSWCLTARHFEHIGGETDYYCWYTLQVIMVRPVDCFFYSTLWPTTATVKIFPVQVCSQCYRNYFVVAPFWELWLHLIAADIQELHVNKNVYFRIAVDH